MPRPDLSQIEGYRDSYVMIAATGVTGGSTIVTTAANTAVNTAGKDSTAVPFQNASATQQGYWVTGTNIALVFDSTSRERIKDANQNYVYGKLTFAASVYTVSFFTMVAAVETAYSFASATNIDLLLPYRFEIGNVRPDYAIRTTQLYPGGEDLGVVGGAGAIFVEETVTLTADNTFPTLTTAPNPVSSVSIAVRGVAEDNLSGGAFTLGGTGNRTVTWSAANAGYTAKSGWRAVYRYRA